MAHLIGINVVLFPYTAKNVFDKYALAEDGDDMFYRGFVKGEGMGVRV